MQRTYSRATFFHDTLRMIWHSRPQSSSAHYGRGGKSSGKPWNKIVSHWFQQKTINVFLIGSFKFARERVYVRRVWRVSEFFPRNVEVNTSGRFLIDFSDSKTMVGHLFQNYDTIYVRFFATYTCILSCCVGFLFPSIRPFSYKRAYICAQKSPYKCVTNKHVYMGSQKVAV